MRCHRFSIFIVWRLSGCWFEIFAFKVKSPAQRWEWLNFDDSILVFSPAHFDPKRDPFVIFLSGGTLASAWENRPMLRMVRSYIVSSAKYYNVWISVCQPTKNRETHGNISSQIPLYDACNSYWLIQKIGEKESVLTQLTHYAVAYRLIDCTRYKSIIGLLITLYVSTSNNIFGNWGDHTEGSPTALYSYAPYSLRPTPSCITLHSVSVYFFLTVPRPLSSVVWSYPISARNWPFSLVKLFPR